MKKILMVLMILALALTGTSALAEEEPVIRPAPDPDNYSGIWVSDRASAEIVWEEEGYRVRIEWASSAWETTEWEYSCYYNVEENTILSVPFGTRTDLVYDDNGEEVSATVIYEDGIAGFFIDEDGLMIWQDEKENAGEGLQFERISDHIELPDIETEG